jgi:hypothetical protein
LQTYAKAQIQRLAEKRKRQVEIDDLHLEGEVDENEEEMQSNASDNTESISLVVSDDEETFPVCKCAPLSIKMFLFLR